MARTKVRLAIVCSKFNEDITNAMLDAAVKRAGGLGAKITVTLRVPGAFDIPFAALQAINRSDVDAVVTLGAIIKGDTLHDEVIANSTANALAALSLKYGKPVTLGISGPGMTERQARARKIEYGERAVETAVELVGLKP